jgi:hypothetical protein
LFGIASIWQKIFSHRKWEFVLWIFGEHLSTECVVLWQACDWSTDYWRCLGPSCVSWPPCSSSSITPGWTRSARFWLAVWQCPCIYYQVSGESGR